MAGPGRVVIGATSAQLAANVPPATTGSVANASNRARMRPVDNSASIRVPLPSANRESQVDESLTRVASPRPGLDGGFPAQRLRRRRPAEEHRPTAATDGDQQSDRAAGLQAGADADAGGAAGLLQSEFAMAQRRARLLQGPARAPDRRHPHRQGQHHRQGDHRQRNPAQPRQQGRYRHRQFLRQEKGADHEHANAGAHRSPPIRPPRSTARARSTARKRCRPMSPPW